MLFPATRLSLRLATTARVSLLRPSVASLRSVSTIRTSQKDEESILIAQRKNRPNSPHLEIYQKQLTAVLSAFHRITGVGLAVGFYAVTCSYAFGIGDTASIIGLVAGFPVAVKFGLKALASFPFAFHSFNGIRHLIWDSGHETYIKGVYRTGYAVLGATAVFGLALMFA